MIFDGKQFAEERRQFLKKEREVLGSLSLGIVMNSNDPVTSSFVRIKEKNAEALDIKLVRYPLSPNSDTKEVLETIDKAKKETGIIIQLPLPENIDVEEVLKYLPRDKDVDAISYAAVERFENGDDTIIPPVAKAIKEIIDSNNIEIKNKKVVVVGSGKLVGKPVSSLMKGLGGNVLILGTNDDISKDVKDADIVVLGAGSPGLLKIDMVKDGVILFDAGTSESGGVVVGDADSSISEKASFFTPVPGGIGPVAVVEIFSNLMVLSKMDNG